MFKRALEVKLVKRNDTTSSEEIKTITVNDVAAAVAHIVDDAGKKIIFGLAAYVIVDTIRQIAVKKIAN